MRPGGLVAVLVLVASLAFAGVASATSLVGGTTTLDAKKSTIKKLKKAGVKVKPAAGATKSGNAFQFAITGGDLDRGGQYTQPSAAAGTVRHDAGLRFKCKAGKVDVTDLVATFGASSDLKGTSKNRDLVLASLNTGGATVTQDGTDIAGVKAKLTKKAAKKIGKACDAKVKAQTLGNLHVQAVPATEVFGGDTQLTLDVGFLGKAIGMGIQTIPLAPATLGPPAPATLTFPVVGGELDPNTFEGEIQHDGGIRLEEDPTEPPPHSTVLQDPFINLTGPTGGTMSLFSETLATRSSLFDLTITGTPEITGGHLSATAEVRMNAIAANSLNLLFSDGGEPAFAAGDLVGTGTVSADVG
jgi:hypothetical protein